MKWYRAFKKGDALTTVLVAGTCDTKDAELRYACECLAAAGVAAQVVDLGTSDTTRPLPPDIEAAEVAAYHPDGVDAVLALGDRGQAVAAMALAFEQYVARRDDIAGILGLGGSGGTALITPAMRGLAVGVPKVMVSTVASGNVGPYVGPSDICMMYSVTDVAGLNRISRVVIGNAAHALAGMARYTLPEASDTKPALGLTMFGVTTPCITQLTEALDSEYDCLVFHATGTGGQSMEKLVDSGDRAGVLGHEYDRSLRFAHGRCDERGRYPPGCHRPQPRALCRRLWRARYGQFRRPRHAAGCISRPPDL